MRQGCIGLAVILMIIIASAVIYTWPHNERFRITVEVQTPEGPRKASGVVQLSFRREIKILPDQMAYYTKLKGEAIAVDLPDKQTLFMLLNGYPGGRDIEVMIDKTLGPRNSLLRRPGAPIRAVPWFIDGQDEELMPAKVSGLPAFVRFDDIRDPTSVVSIDPHAMSNAFGEGISLIKVTIQPTKDPVTVEILAHLPWLKRYNGLKLDGSRLGKSQGLQNSLSSADFSQGLM